MSDEVDIANDLIDSKIDTAVAKIRSNVKHIEPNPGVCKTCDEDSPRLIDGECVWCVENRDRPE